MPEFCDVHAVQLRELDKRAETRPLLFRDEARRAYANYTRQQRRIAKRLKTPEVTVFDFYMAWRDRYMARMQRITAAVQTGKLDKMLTRVLLLPDDASVKQLTQALSAKHWLTRYIISAASERAAQRKRWLIWAIRRWRMILRGL